VPRSFETAHIERKSECITEFGVIEFSVLHIKKTWWQKNVQSVLCSGAFLYLRRLLFEA